MEGVYLSLEGKGKADKDRREQQPVVLFPGGGGSPPEHKLKGRAAFGYKQLGCPLSDAAAHERIFWQFPSRTEVKLACWGLIDAMGVLPVALFITVLFYSTNQL